jgi:hypothetical protein
MTAYKSTRLLVMVLFVFKSNSIIAFLFVVDEPRYRACLENELGIQSRVCLFLECFDSGFVGEGIC